MDLRDLLTGLPGEQFIVDFPDALTAKILADRWLYTANLLGVTYQHHVIPFGDGKYHYTANAVGEPEDVAKLSEFIEDSIRLLDNFH